MGNINFYKLSSYLIIILSLLGLFHFNLMVPLVGGMIMYIIVLNLHNFIKTKIHSKTANQITIFFLTLLIFAIFSAIGFGIYYILNIGKDNYQNFGESVFSTIELMRTYIPSSLHAFIPENFFELKNKLITITKNALPDVFDVSKKLTLGLMHIIIGMFIGSLIAFSMINNQIIINNTPFTKELLERIRLFVNIFHKVVFAQVKISAINSILTGIYLLVILPIFGIDIPYAKTLVILTFLCGLIPVVGNLISNTLIALLSLKVSFTIAIVSLIFLVVVHKLEYYINAKIVGNELKISIWEMLIVMLIFESTFGIIGVALSPVIYGYLKEELIKNKLVWLKIKHNHQQPIKENKNFI